MGLTLQNGDCNDGAKDVFPGAADVPDDGIDQDCSGNDSVSCYVDKDGDGFGVGNSVIGEGTCSGGGYAAKAGDCNDANASIFPTAHEVPGDGVDSNCDGADPYVSDAGGTGGAGSATDAGVPDASVAATGGTGNHSTSPSVTDASMHDAGIQPLNSEARNDGGCGCRTTRRDRFPVQLPFVAIALGLLGHRRRRKG
jgi:MYXO-CTERM domain-containing protein